MVSLIEKYNGDYLKVCEHYADYLISNERLFESERQEFIDWMLTKENLFPRLKICGDPRIYEQAFLIMKKVNDDSQEQQHLIIIGGAVGKGKTTFAAQLSALIDPTYCLERVCYLPVQFFKVIKSLKPGQVIHIDEGGNFFKALNTSTRASKVLGQYFQMNRAKRLVIIINYDDYEKMNKEIREKADTVIYKIPNPKEEAPRKFRYYWWYKTNSVKDINNFYSNKKKLPLTHYDMRKFISFKGNNHRDYPLINDLSEDVFKSNKLKYIEMYENYMMKEFDDIEAKSKGLDSGEDNKKVFIPPREVRKRYSLSDNKMKALRDANPSMCLKVGNGYRYDEEKLQKLLINESNNGNRPEKEGFSRNAET